MKLLYSACALCVALLWMSDGIILHGYCDSVYQWSRTAVSPAGWRPRWLQQRRISSCSTWRASSVWRRFGRRCFGVGAVAGASTPCQTSAGNLGTSCWKAVWFLMMSWTGSACWGKKERKKGSKLFCCWVKSIYGLSKKTIRVAEIEDTAKESQRSNQSQVQNCYYYLLSVAIDTLY